jgi:hypothetical protein
MAVWVIVLIVVLGVLALLFVGGLAGNARVRAREEDRHAERIAAADHALAQARAEDRGWNRTALELIQVVDRPGTDEDRARFRARTAEGFEELELARAGDEWRAPCAS